MASLAAIAYNFAEMGARRVAAVKGAVALERSMPSRRMSMGIRASICCVVVIGCSSSLEPQPAATGRATSTDARASAEQEACRALDSSDLAARSDAMRRLRERAPVVVGGTEQQMEAAGAFCDRTYGMRPSWMPSK
jgi:hypothetical protein